MTAKHSDHIIAVYEAFKEQAFRFTTKCRFGNIIL